ncbi:hypothetical protein GCM10007304_10450 [Rhodococcoides trifolii]|uniref:DUF998 domain-containing protein n=2 Tax=Rhodococcoides trifolii TaxID=908250 RepID=A0A917FRS8_9NOCA|nr:hypothetical protein GCM10007304_10450 [Rhodococcus trifolii]
MVGGLDVRNALASADELRRTISQYGLGPDRWIFNLGVLALAVGSVLVLAPLVRRGITTWRSGASIAMWLWAIGLVVVVAVPKQDWSQPQSIGGDIHRLASVVAFVALPFAAILLSRRWRRDEMWGRYAQWTFGLGIASAVAFLPLIYSIVGSIVTGTPWYRLITLGWVERVLVVVEVLAVIAIGVWAVVAAPVGREKESSRTPFRARVPKAPTESNTPAP